MKRKKEVKMPRLKKKYVRLTCSACGNTFHIRTWSPEVYTSEVRKKWTCLLCATKKEVRKMLKAKEERQAILLKETCLKEKEVKEMIYIYIENLERLLDLSDEELEEYDYEREELEEELDELYKKVELKDKKRHKPV